VVGLLLIPHVGSAQTVAGVARVPPITITRVAPVPRGGTTPSAERPTETRVPPPAQSRDLFLATPDTYAPRYDRLPGRFHHQPRFLSGYGYFQDVYVPAPSLPIPLQEERFPEAEGDGFLRLIVEPAAAQVYVDGYFVGTVAEFSGLLESGSHRVELRAPGFHSVAFDVRISVHETVTYRNTLTRSGSTPEPVRPVISPPNSRTLYVIPRCYAGDTPPRATQLPTGCDVAHVRRIPHP
jgi:hypothetical protein